MGTTTFDGEIEMNFDEGPPSEKAGDAVGRYRLVKELGAGGFGTVWLAEQTEPVKRDVALKIIKLGMDTRQVVARFEQERQALALMDHPHVARVLDAGATNTGRPYFVMDLVQGEPIGAYCDRRRLTIEERLELFAQVCAAVQHAHGKGIIHRDLKPSNLLVGERDGKAHATVIDFGIAKATAGKLTEKTLATQERQVIGTPAYMSPEQAAGSLDIDTRTDVYSLGVVLYELLTGVAPYDGKAMLCEVQRMILEVEPTAPSSRISSSRETLPELAACRRIEPRRLCGRIAGELDWIVLKALEKERTRRYQTALELAADVRRFLAGEPVFAAPPSRLYRFGKFVRRNRLLVAAASATAVALVVGAVGATWGMLEAEKQRAIADGNARLEAAERRRAESVSSLLERLLDGLDPTSEAEGGVALREQLIARLDSAVQELETFAGDALTKARLQRSLGKTLMGLADYAKATPLFRSALEARRARLGAGDARTRESMFDLAAAYQQSGKQAEAMALVQSLREGAAGEPPPSAADANECDELAAMIHQAAGRHEEAVKLLEAAKRRIDAEGGPDTDGRLLTLHNLGAAYRGANRHRESVPLLEDVRRRREALLGPDHADTLMTLNSLAVAYCQAGRNEDAVKLEEEALVRLQKRYPPDHLAVLGARANLAAGLGRSGRNDEALAMLADAKSRALAKYGAAYPYTSVLTLELANALTRAGKWGEAASEAEALIQPLVDAFGPEHPRVGAALRVMSKATAQSAGKKEAVGKLERLAERADATSGANSLFALKVRSELGLALRNAGSPKKGLTLLTEVLARQTEALGAEHQDVLTTAYHAGCCHFTERDFPAAIETFERILPVQRTKLGAASREALATQTSLAAAYWSVGRLDVSVPMFEDALQKLVAAFGEADADVMENVENLAVNYDSAKQFDKLADFLKVWQPRVARARGAGDSRALYLASGWVSACKMTNRLAECVPALEALRDRMAKTRRPDDPNLRKLLDDLASAYSSARNYERSIPLLEDLLAQSRVRAGEQAEATLRLAERLAADRRAADAAAATTRRTPSDSSPAQK